MAEILPPLPRPAPPMPKIKPVRPDYETMLRDQFAMAALPYALDCASPQYDAAAKITYTIADAMLEARNANR